MSTTTTATTTTAAAAAASTAKQEELEQSKAFDKATEKGQDGGLFQACMKAIRSSHASGNRMRTGLVVAGMFTDVNMWREVVAIFYLVTQEMESKMYQLQEKNKDEICQKLLSLGYHFTPGYEKDLETLYGVTWKQDVQTVLDENKQVQLYCEKVRHMTSGAQVAGAAFCLWGGLIIGGGAVAKVRVLKLCGPEATHMFESVTGPGRNERKTKWIQVWDSLATTPNNDDNTSGDFDTIVVNCQECMQHNNALLASIKKYPWWWKYLASGAAACTAVGVALLLRQRGRS